jgi:hypothetical protein
MAGVRALARKKGVRLNLGLVMPRFQAFPGIQVDSVKQHGRRVALFVASLTTTLAFDVQLEDR